MRVLCSNKTRYVKGVGEVAVWFDASFPAWEWIPDPEGVRSQVLRKYIREFTDEESFIRTYYAQKLQPGDFDNCGWETVYFVFSTGKAFKLEHYWGHNLEYDPEDDYSEWASYDMEMGECPFDEVPEYMKLKDRDWLI